MINLLPDQEKLVASASEMMSRGRKSVLMQSATGSGKTIIASAIVQRAQAKGKRTWFIVPRRDLIKQTAKTYMDFGTDFSFIAAGYSHELSAQNKICSMETLVRRLGESPPPHLAIIDESHVGSGSLSKVVDYLKASGSYILGLSATPMKLSGRGMGDWFDDMICGESIRWLIDNGRLSDYRAFAPTHLDLSAIPKANGDYAIGKLNDYMLANGAVIGDAVQHYKDHAMGKLNIAYGVSIAHSKMIAQKFNDGGVPAAHLDGETPDDQKRKIIDAYARREILVLCNCELLTYGFDLAAWSGMDVTVECMSDLRSTQSLALQMQKWGRVLRKKDQPALIFDHANNIMQHGLPCEDREWSLQGKEKGAGRDCEPTIPVRQCTQCFRCHKPAPICPSCGFVYPIEGREVSELAGTLSEVKSKEEMMRLKQKAAEEAILRKRRLGMARTLADLRSMASDYGYKQGWIYQIAKIKNIKS